jgi:hypothetical protein
MTQEKPEVLYIAQLWALTGIVRRTRPAICNQGVGQIVTAPGRACGHEHRGAGLRLSAATQALVADPAVKGIPGQLGAGPARPVPSTAGGVLSQPFDARQRDRASACTDRAHIHDVVRWPHREDG